MLVTYLVELSQVVCLLVQSYFLQLLSVTYVLIESQLELNLDLKLQLMNNVDHLRLSEAFNALKYLSNHLRRTIK